MDDETNAKMLNYWLRRFVLEIHNQDGSEYPLRALFIVCGLLCHLLEENIQNLNFLDEHDLSAVFRKVLDVCMKESLSKGSGTKVRQVDSIMPEDEEKIWTRGVHRI